MDAALFELFSGLTSEASVRASFVIRKYPETIHVEFKTKADSRIPDLEYDDKRNFAKALSSFSNADGGILVWGINTRRKSGRDFASGLKPIKQVEDMAERLRSFLIDGRTRS